MRGLPSCLLQSAGGEANRILLASASSSMCIICPNRLSRRDWIIAVSLGSFVSLRTSPFRTNWYHLMPSSIRRHHWSSASILRASVLDIADVEDDVDVWHYAILELHARNDDDDDDDKHVTLIHNFKGGGSKQLSKFHLKNSH